MSHSKSYKEYTLRFIEMEVFEIGQVNTLFVVASGSWDFRLLSY